MNQTDWRNAYLRLHPKAALKHLETPYVYHIAKDELYEIDERAMDFLKQCDGTRTGRELTEEEEAVEYCLEEGIIEALPHRQPITVSVGASDHPSLRYLELHLLHRCNLACRHCYLGPPRSEELPLADAVDITRQFSRNGGLRLLISGGEPLLYRHLPDYLNQTQEVKIRRILFTNGTLITPANIEQLPVDELQFSLDGWRRGHEALRGKGTFDKLINGVNAAIDAGIAVSFSTMIHRENLTEFDRMQRFMEEIGAVEWGVDILTVSGSLDAHRELCVPYDAAAPLMEYAYGGGYHGSSDGFACGRHLMAVMPDGRAVKCGFYRDESLGDARASLRDAWRNMSHIPLDRLECRDCEYIEECRGGCRYRAAHALAPDLAMCSLYGVANAHECE